MTAASKLLSASGGGPAEPGLDPEDMFKTNLWTGLRDTAVTRAEITSANSRTDNHIAILLAMNHDYNNANRDWENKTNLTEDFSSVSTNLDALAGGTSASNGSSYYQATYLFSGSSEGAYVEQVPTAFDFNTIDQYQYTATFQYGNATGVSWVATYNNFNFGSSGSTIQSGDLIIFISFAYEQPTTQSPSNVTVINNWIQSAGTYGTGVSVAVRIADGTENGTDFGDNLLLSPSWRERAIVLRKTGGSWDISTIGSTFSRNVSVPTVNGQQRWGHVYNDLDLKSGKGLVWIKNRTTSQNHVLFDTERGGQKYMSTNLTVASSSANNGLIDFTSNGYHIGDDYTVNELDAELVGWSFKDTEGFFRVIKYTGNGTSGRTLTHDLGTTVGMVVIKKSSASDDWWTWHKDLPTSSWFKMNSEDGPSTSQHFEAAPTSTTLTLTGNDNVNGNGNEYMAYIFAHNNGDASFGPTGNQDIIKCGSFTGNGSTQVIDLGFEPQWIFFRNTSDFRDNLIYDTMRGISMSGNDAQLQPWRNANEGTINNLKVLSDGFKVNSGTMVNQNGSTILYMAIRRPTYKNASFRQVLNIDEGTGINNKIHTFTRDPVDWVMTKSRNGSSTYTGSRLQMNDYYLQFDGLASEANYAGGWKFDQTTGFSQNQISNTPWTVMLSKSHGAFDCIHWEGGPPQQAKTVKHNLGVTPEVIWVLDMDTNGSKQYIDVSDPYGFLRLFSDDAISDTTIQYLTSATDTDMTFPAYTFGVQNVNYLGLLFASKDDVSKVGSYTGNDSSNPGQFIDCGFSPSMIIIRRINTTGNWWVFDDVAGLNNNDHVIAWNNSSAEVTIEDTITPDSSGFYVKQNSTTNANVNASSYRFIAFR